ncbi:pro-sigmaK processing inhibitor BofA family protein [Intestinimonas sp.]|uniref:pro-sigmaK processing inhibitor BofA family protein n=1 Tax=Intestinimonas sp. TaxID=1965293 RepID=UPI0026063B94|nr:pro-sigmaK processing inhibitor BofA family protein [Intestinimonas sp.]
MTALSGTLPWLLVGLTAVGVLLLLRAPIRFLGRLCLRTLVSLGALAAFSPLGAPLGCALGINLANALVLALLGAPGFGLLLLLNWALGL